MKLSAVEEYGLRCLLSLGSRQAATRKSVTISEISKAEGLSVPHVAKLMRILRIGGLVESVRGHAGGYKLSRPPDKIVMDEVLTALGGRLFDPEFCEAHTENGKRCSHSIGCSIRPLWHMVQAVVDRELSKITLEDLLGKGQPAEALSFNQLLQISNP